MNILRAVQANTDKKVFHLKKFSPFIGNGKSIRLDRILNTDVLLVVFADSLREKAKKVESRQSGFSTLKCKRYKTTLFKFFKAAPNQHLRRIERHHTVNSTRTLFLFISIEAILAAHIAETRCGFYQKLKLPHRSGYGFFTHKQVFPISILFFTVFQCINEQSTQFVDALRILLQNILRFVRVIAQIKVQLFSRLRIPYIFILFSQDKMHGILT